jgi:hypothetical protein
LTAKSIGPASPVTPVTAAREKTEKTSENTSPMMAMNWAFSLR